jgi:hypothetical protein
MLEQFRGMWAGAALFSAAAIVPLPATAQARLFTEDTEIQFVIEGPIGALVRASPNSTDAVAAAVTLPGVVQAAPFEIQLSPRGISRRVGGICTFPPLRLDFDRPALRGTVLEGQNRLKLVTRCRSGYEALTVLEYTAYRLYNVITPLSYRVRPARVTYRDNQGRRREETQFNFLIESTTDVARRNGRVALEVMPNDVASSELDPAASATVGLFQYMIGNLDWDMVSGRAGEECCHNGKLIAGSATSRTNVVPLPYDFDYSGFVNAPYAVPPESLRVSNVRQRLYRGYCRHNHQLPAVAETFRSQRAQLYAVIDGETRIPEARRRTARRYIEEFFAILDDPERFQRQIVDRCR